MLRVIDIRFFNFCVRLSCFCIIHHSVQLLFDFCPGKLLGKTLWMTLVKELRS